MMTIAKWVASSRTLPQKNIVSALKTLGGDFVESRMTDLPQVPVIGSPLTPDATMKKIALLLSVCAGFSALAPSTALADHRSYRSRPSSCERRVADHCDRCGDRVYQELRVVGYDHCGRPVYRWVTLGHSCHHHSYRNEISVGGFRFRF